MSGNGPALAGLTILESFCLNVSSYSLITPGGWSSNLYELAWATPWTPAPGPRAPVSPNRWLQMATLSVLRRAAPPSTRRRNGPVRTPRWTHPSYARRRTRSVVRARAPLLGSAPRLWEKDFTGRTEPGEVSPSRFRHPSQDAPFASLRATPSDPRCRELARFEGARPPPGRAPSSDNLGAGKTLRAQPREPGLAAMDKTTGQVGPHRDTLIKRGLCYSPRYGVIAFTVPMFDQFVQRWLG